MKKFIRLLFCCMLLFPLMVMAQAQTPVKKKPAGTGVKKPVTTSKTKTGTTSKSVLQASINRGKQVYAANCLACHQADGNGVPNLNPPLIKTKWVLGSKTVLVQQILKGSAGQIEIDGETYHNAMPPLPHLTDQQIADVLTYVRNSFGNKASIVTTAEVKAIRAKTKGK